MPITTDKSAPLFAVVGATGVQGRSVIDAIAADPSHYRVRGFMRDTKKAGDLPSLGVEPVALDLESASSLRRGLQRRTTCIRRNGSRLCSLAIYGSCALSTRA